MRIATFLSFILIFNWGINAQTANVNAGKIEHYLSFQSSFVGPRNIDIWLPEGYDSTLRYPVLYMQDGKALFDAAIMWNHQSWNVDETAQYLISQKQIRPFILVAIWNAEKYRHSEFCPQKPFESLDSFTQQKLYKAKRRDSSIIFNRNVYADAYLKFLVTELKPFVDSHYSTLVNRENTSIAGSSMGAMISLYAVCEYPEVFGTAACISTHWPVIYTAKDNPFPEAFFKYLNENLPDPQTHRLYFDYGTATLDTLYRQYQIKVDAILESKGYRAPQLKSMVFPGAEHNENAWNKRVWMPLVFLFKQ